MAQYTLTVFDRSGEKLVDEKFDAKNDEEAKKIGERRLKEEKLENNTSRVTSADGRLVLFHR